MAWQSRRAAAPPEAAELPHNSLRRNRSAISASAPCRSRCLQRGSWLRNRGSRESRGARRGEGRDFVPHAETKAKPVASCLADQRAHELLANALAACIRFHADHHLRRLFIPIGEPELFGGNAPCPGCTDDFAVLFGDEPEIPGSPPVDDIFGHGRNRLRRPRIRFIGRHREEIPQYLEVILDSRTDQKIGHGPCSQFIETARSHAVGIWDESRWTAGTLPRSNLPRSGYRGSDLVP